MGRFYMSTKKYPKIKNTDSIKYMCNVDITYYKGVNYYKNNRVISVTKNQNKYKAQVLGTNLYNVELTFKGDILEKSKCTCPAFSHYYGICKHIVATLLYMYYMEDITDETNYIESNMQITQKSNKQTAQNIYYEAFDYIRDKNNNEENVVKKYKEVVALPIMEKERKYKAFLLNNLAFRIRDKNKKFEYLAQANLFYPESKKIAITALQTWCDIGNRKDFEKALQIGERSLHLQSENNDADDIEIKKLLNVVYSKMNNERKDIIIDNKPRENRKISNNKEYTIMDENRKYSKRDVIKKTAYIVIGILALAIWIGIAVGLTFAIEKEFSIITFISCLILIPVIVAIVIKLYMKW